MNWQKEVRRRASKSIDIFIHDSIKKGYHEPSFYFTSNWLYSKNRALLKMVWHFWWNVRDILDLNQGAKLCCYVTLSISNFILPLFIWHKIFLRKRKYSSVNWIQVTTTTTKKKNSTREYWVKLWCLSSSFRLSLSPDTASNAKNFHFCQ